MRTKNLLSLRIRFSPCAWVSSLPKNAATVRTSRYLCGDECAGNALHLDIPAEPRKISPVLDAGMDCGLPALHRATCRKLRFAPLAMAVFLQGGHHSVGRRVFCAVSVRGVRHLRQKAALPSHRGRPGDVVY